MLFWNGLDEMKQVYFCVWYWPTCFYPFVTSVNIQALAGIILWVGSFHLNYDNKIPVASTNLESKNQSLVLLNYFFNKKISISLSKDFEQNENKVLLMYNF